jgi:hypothetical protein
MGLSEPGLEAKLTAVGEKQSVVNASTTALLQASDP